MKTWTMPQVEIEAFRTNEYVAACVDPGPVIDNLGYFYVDFNNSGTYDKYFESFPKSGTYYKNNGHSDQTSPGWHNDVHLIPCTDPMGANYGESYSNREFRAPTTKTYDIYILSGNNPRFYIYEHVEGGHSGVPGGTGVYFS